MNNITLTCPECNKPDRAVGNPAEHLLGHFGAWYCFYCGAKGNYSIAFQRKVDDPADEASIAENA